MNREILFRGKRMDNGQWVEGDLVRLKDGKKSTPHIYGYGEVDPNTVGQYTGLTDKNGRKVFEGDICRTMVCDMTVEKDCGIVCYDSMGMLSLKRVDGVYSDFFFHINIGCVDAYSIEVIGNIHDNPELLD